MVRTVHVAHLPQCGTHPTRALATVVCGSARCCGKKLRCVPVHAPAERVSWVGFDSPALHLRLSGMSRQSRFIDHEFPFGTGQPP